MDTLKCGRDHLRQPCREDGRVAAAVAVLLGLVGLCLVLAGMSRPASTAAEGPRTAPAAMATANPLPASSTSSGGTQSGHRVVRLTLDAATLPPGLAIGEVADVVAAVGDPQSGDARVVPVASGVLVALGSSLAIDVDQAGAERLLWAEAFAKALRVLARPPGDTSSPPAEVTGLSAQATAR